MMSSDPLGVFKTKALAFSMVVISANGTALTLRLK